MSYVVLARKYRPLRFEDMVGQEHVTRTLRNAIEQGRVHHAYLFAGARGLGKTTTARIFAKGLVCEKGPTAQPCNACNECRAVNESRSVDVIEIDGASNNSVDNIRGLREQVHYLPQTARCKIYIIDEVHMLTTSAFNALLKTLEEPPAHVNFIFATTEPQKVLPTILSRVSRLDFRRVTPEQSIAHLRSILEQEELGVDDGGLRIIVRAAGGSVRDSLTLLDQVIAFGEDPKGITEAEVLQVLGQAERAGVESLVDAVLDRDPDAVVARFDALVEAGHDLTVLSLQVLEHLRDLMLVRVCRRDDVVRGATEAELGRLKAQAAKVEPTTIGQLFDRFTRLVERLPDSRVPRLLLEMGLLELAHAEPLVPLGDLVERLHALEGGGATGQGSGGGVSAASGSRAGGGRPATRGGARMAPAPASSEPAPSESHRAPPGGTAREPGSLGSPARELSLSGAATPGAPEIGESPLARDLWNVVKASGLVGRDGAGSTGDEPRAQTPASAPSPARAGATNGSPAPSGRSGERNEAKPTTADADPGSCAGLSSTCSEAPRPAPGIEIDALPSIEAWERLVDRIREEDEFVSAVLSEVGLAALGDGILRVAAPRGSFPHIELTERPDIRAHVEQAARDHFGRPFRLELVEGDPALPELPSIVLVQAHRRAQHKAQIEEEARANGAIQSLLRLFDAQLTSTRPLSEP